LAIRYLIIAKFYLYSKFEVLIFMRSITKNIIILMPEFNKNFFVIANTSFVHCRKFLSSSSCNYCEGQWRSLVMALFRQACTLHKRSPLVVHWHHYRWTDISLSLHLILSIVIITLLEQLPGTASIWGNWRCAFTVSLCYTGVSTKTPAAVYSERIACPLLQSAMCKLIIHRSAYNYQLVWLSIVTLSLSRTYSTATYLYIDRKSRYFL